jgi:hypothetical protein
LHGRLLYGEANLKRSQGAYNEAAALYENLISLVEQVKGQVDPNAQRSLSETYGFIYDELIEAIYTRNVGAAERDLERTAAGFVQGQIQRSLFLGSFRFDRRVE